MLTTGQQQRGQIGLAERGIGIGRRRQLGHQVVRGAGDVGRRCRCPTLWSSPRFRASVRSSRGWQSRSCRSGRRTCSVQERADHPPCSSSRPESAGADATLISAQVRAELGLRHVVVDHQVLVRDHANVERQRLKEWRRRAAGRRARALEVVQQSGDERQRLAVRSALDRDEPAQTIRRRAVLDASWSTRGSCRLRCAALRESSSPSR